MFLLGPSCLFLQCFNMVLCCLHILGKHFPHILLRWLLLCYFLRWIESVVYSPFEVRMISLTRIVSVRVGITLLSCVGSHVSDLLLEVQISASKSLDRHIQTYELNFHVFQPFLGKLMILSLKEKTSSNFATSSSKVATIATIGPSSAWST